MRRCAYAVRMGVGVAVGLAAWGPAGAAQAALPVAAREQVRRIAVQHQGRLKPFDSFARETLDRITGAARIDGQEPVDTVASILSDPEPWQERRLISIPFVPLRQALGMDPKARAISYNELIATRKLMRMLPAIMEKQQQNQSLSMLENETMDAFDRFVQFSGLLEHRLAVVPAASGSADPAWRAPGQLEGYALAQQQAVHAAWSGWIAALDGSSEELEAASRQLHSTLQAVNPALYPAAWRLDGEVLYNRVGPFRWARLAYLLACAGLLLGITRPAWGSAARAGAWVLGVGLALHAGGITARVILGGRPPVSNFYETTLWLPFVGIVVAVVLDRIYRVPYLTLSASLLGAIALVLADHLPLDPSISPVVAVLRSNYWLTIHVLTIVASYGALTLATVLSHVYGSAYLRKGRRHPALPMLETLIYRVLQVGVVLLAGGIMLGAVWANASWGRYWGWDPKETWALITLLWFLAVLHGRFAGWIHGVGLALSTIGGFLLLLMTYYGVSFYLVGLHSYAGGHAKPLPPLLVGYLIAESAFMAALWFRTTTRPRSAS